MTDLARTTRSPARPRWAPASPETREALRLVRLVEDAFNTRQPWRLEDAVGDHLLDHSPSLGHTDLRQRIELVRTTMPDARLSVDEVLAQGDLVATRWSIEGTHRAKMLGVPPTGRAVRLRGVSVERLADGRVVEHWEFPDLADLARQLRPAA